MSMTMGDEGAATQERHDEAAAPAGAVARSDERLCVENRVEGKALQVLRKIFVKPAAPTPSEKRWLPLSNLDRNWVPFYTNLLCVYRKVPWAGGKSTVGEHLRKSLERALELFYPLAGRVLTSGKGQAPGILCNDAGAVFVEASIDAELDELQYDSDFQPSFLLTGMAEAGLGNYPQLPDDPAGRPALIVQVTHFKCGGITLASNWSHPVADGYSGFHFMKSWAELARVEEVSVPPVHDRTLVKPREPLVLSDPWSEDCNLELSNIHGLDLSQEGELESGAAVSGHRRKYSTTTVQVVEITKQLIDDLKREVAMGASPENQTRLSRVCYVSAHLWRAAVKARGIHGTDLVRFWTLIEGRKTLSLPAGYFGNAISALFTTTTASNVLNKPLAYSASLIASSIQHATTEMFQNLVDWIEAKLEMPFPGKFLGQDHECGTSWQNRFPYYDLDYGFGVPACSMRNANAAWDGYFVMLPSSRSPDNFTAMLHISPDVMKRFVPLVQHFSYLESRCLSPGT